MVLFTCPFKMPAFYTNTIHTYSFRHFLIQTIFFPAWIKKPASILAFSSCTHTFNKITSDYWVNLKCDSPFRATYNDPIQTLEALKLILVLAIMYIWNWVSDIFGIIQNHNVWSPLIYTALRFFLKWLEIEEWFWVFKPFSKLKATFYKYWTSIKIKISMTCVYKEHEV